MFRNLVSKVMHVKKHNRTVLCLKSQLFEFLNFTTFRLIAISNSLYALKQACNFGMNCVTRGLHFRQETQNFILISTRSEIK